MSIGELEAPRRGRAPTLQQVTAGCYTGTITMEYDDRDFLTRSEYVLQEDVRRLQRKRAERKQTRRNTRPVPARPDEIDPRLAKYFD